MARTKNGPTKSCRRAASGSEARHDSRVALAARTQRYTEAADRTGGRRSMTEHYSAVSAKKDTTRAEHVEYVPPTLMKTSVRGVVSGADVKRSMGSNGYAVVEVDGGTDDEDEDEDGSGEEDDDDEADSNASKYEPAFARKPFPFNDAFLDSEKGKSLAQLLEPDTKIPVRIPVVRPAHAPPISPDAPSPPPDWPYPPHSSTWELFVLASACVLSQYPAVDHATLARELSAELIPQRTRTSSRVVSRFLAEGAMRARAGIRIHADELPNISTSTHGVKRPVLLVRATAHILRACPDIGHGDLASLLARAATFEGNKPVVQLVRDIQDAALSVSSTAPPYSSIASRHAPSTHATSHVPPIPSPTAFNPTTERLPQPPRAPECVSPIHGRAKFTPPSPLFKGCSQETPAPKSPIPAPCDAPQSTRARPLPRANTPEPLSTPFRPSTVPSPPSPAPVPSPVSTSVPLPTASPVPSPTAQVLALISGLPPAERVRLALSLAGALTADVARTVGGVVLRAVRARIEGRDGGSDRMNDSTGARSARREPPLPSPTHARSPHLASPPPDRSPSTLGRKRPATESIIALEPPAKRVRPGIPPPTAYTSTDAPRSYGYADHDEDDKARLHQQPPQRRAYVVAQAQAAASAKARRVMHG